MIKIFESYPLKLTTITPVHIGSGKLFEDYRCIIAKDKLRYYAEDDIAKLIADNPDKIDMFSDSVLLSIMALLKAKGNSLKPLFELPCKVTNLRELKRNAWDSLTEKAYIPGSSLKGAIRTSLTTGKIENTKVTDNPFKWLKISDCFSEQQDITQIGYFLGYKETSQSNTKLKSQFSLWSYEKPSNRRINYGDYIKSSVEFNANIQIDQSFNQMVSNINEFADLAVKVNLYYLPKFSAAIAKIKNATCERGKFVNDNVIRQLEDIQAKIEQNQDKMCVIHLGWHSEQLHHLLPENVNSKISRHSQAHQRYAADRSVVQWMVSASYSEKQAVPDDLMPMGWVVLSTDSLGLSAQNTSSGSVSVAAERQQGKISAELVAKYKADKSFDSLAKLCVSGNNLMYKVEPKLAYLVNKLRPLFAELMARELITDSWRKNIIIFTSQEALDYCISLWSTAE